MLENANRAPAQRPCDIYHEIMTTPWKAEHKKKKKLNKTIYWSIILNNNNDNPNQGIHELIDATVLQYRYTMKYSILLHYNRASRTYYLNMGQRAVDIKMFCPFSSGIIIVISSHAK